MLKGAGRWIWSSGMGGWLSQRLKTAINITEHVLFLFRRHACYLLYYLLCACVCVLAHMYACACTGRRWHQMSLSVTLHVTLFPSDFLKQGLSLNWSYPLGYTGWPASSCFYLPSVWSIVQACCSPEAGCILAGFSVSMGNGVLSGHTARDSTLCLRPSSLVLWRFVYFETGLPFVA